MYRFYYKQIYNQTTLVSFFIQLPKETSILTNFKKDVLLNSSACILYFNSGLFSMILFVVKREYLSSGWFIFLLQQKNYNTIVEIEQYARSPLNISSTYNL